MEFESRFDEYFQSLSNSNKEALIYRGFRPKDTYEMHNAFANRNSYFFKLPSSYLQISNLKEIKTFQQNDELEVKPILPNSSSIAFSKVATSTMLKRYHPIPIICT